MTFLRLFPIAAALLVLGLSSCNEDIDFAGDGKETAVIYGLLNQADSVQYIKITRAFGGGNNSLEVAQVADSNYFQVIDVKVEEVVNNVITRTWNLDDTLVEGKEDGVFYGPEQKLYYFKTPAGAGALNPDARYRLTANVNNGEFIVTAETPLVKGLAVTSPSGLGSYSFANADVPANGYKTASVNINPGTSDVVDCRMEVYFSEYFSGGPVERSFTWKLGELSGSSIPSSGASFSANGKVFYELVAQNVTNDPTITKREFTRVKLKVTAGTEELSKYLLVNKPASSLAQSKPTYTNLSASDGRRVIGLFAARSTVIQEKQKWANVPPAYYRALDKNSIKELCTGAITGGFLFCSDNPLDQPESYFCD